MRCLGVNCFTELENNHKNVGLGSIRQKLMIEQFYPAFFCPHNQIMPSNQYTQEKFGHKTEAGSNTLIFGFQKKFHKI